MDKIISSVPILGSLLQKSVFRYIFAGGLAYLVEMAILAVLHYGLGLPDLVSAAISFWLGYIFAFFMQRIFTFKDTSRQGGRLARQFIFTTVLLGFNYAFTLTLVHLFSPALGVIVMRTVAIVVTTMWNYVIMKRLFAGSQKQEVVVE